VNFSPSERAALVNGLTSGTSTRANMLRQIAENERFVNTKRNKMFVSSALIRGLIYNKHGMLCPNLQSRLDRRPVRNSFIFHSTNQRGLAAAQCGKASPFRHATLLF